MAFPVQISFRGIPSSPAIEEDVRVHALRLERYHQHVMGCRVIIESPHRHHHQGKLYHVRINLAVPGTELVVSRDPSEHQAHEDVYVAIRDAFDAARRRLEDQSRRQHGAVKQHAPPARARVRRLFPREGYGFLETPGGREIYFHRHSVLDDAFGRLEVGTYVEFVEEPGENGPQASTVRVGTRRNA